ncbi:MAG: glycosyltransferase family 4 protein [Armatimonadetes bacterium]|nr:glycosyltransferase family 4 protein [Armatimonadota bacterium]
MLTRCVGALKARSLLARAEEVKVAYLSTYPPRECGIATFCEDLIRATGGDGAFPDPAVIAMEGGARYHRYSRPVVHVVDDRSEQDYQTAAEFINDSSADVVSIQHEFGIYGGAEGRGLYRFLSTISKPVVTNLHTVVPQPNQMIGDMVRALAEKSERVMVMNPIAGQILSRDYGVSLKKVSFINHGAPSPSTEPREASKQRLGVGGKTVMCTFGLVGAGKGLEYAIQALPHVLRRHPELVYLIVGETHPGAIHHGVDEYRESLTRLIGELGVEDSVRFVNRYLTKDEIVSYLTASDIYITPYINPHQICSGTLAYAVAAGKAIISTAYLHARFLLGGERGLLVDFASPASIAEAARRILDAPELQADLERKTRAYGRRLLWGEVGARYRSLLREVVGRPRLKRPVPATRTVVAPAPTIAGSVVP